MLHSAAIGAGRNPRFGGGRYRLPGFFCIGNLEADCKETKTRKQKSSRKAGMLHPPHFSCYTPPFVPVTKNKRPPVTRKTPQIGPSNRLRKPGCPVRRIVVNRDSFRDLGSGQFVERCRPLHGWAEAAVAR